MTRARLTAFATLTLALLAAPLAAEGQPAGKVYRVGILTDKPSARQKFVCGRPFG